MSLADDIRLLMAEQHVINPWLRALERASCVAATFDVDARLLVVAALVRTVHVLKGADLPIAETVAMVRAGAEHLASGKNGATTNLLDLPEFARFRPPAPPTAGRTEA